METPVQQSVSAIRALASSLAALTLCDVNWLGFTHFGACTRDSRLLYINKTHYIHV